MILAAVAVLGLQQSAAFTAGRFELAERLRRVEVAWMATTDRERRRAACEHLTKATTAFFSMRGSEACESMDEALARLEGRRLRPADAMNIRPDKPFCEPGATVPLRITWAYRPASVIPIRVTVGSTFLDVRPGSSSSMNVNPWVVSPELRQNQEVGYLMPIRVGNDQRYSYVSFVRRIQERLERLKGSSTPFVSDMAKLLEGFQQAPSTVETELPLVQYLFAAEAVEEGKSRLADLEQVFYARQGQTVLRAAFPKKRPEGPLTVVIGMHGAGGSENMFFEAYGRGLAVSETLKRGWVFVSPRAGSTAIEDSLTWIRQTRSAAIGKVFLVGHSMGAAAILGGKYPAVPTAIAALAPATASVAENLALVPLFVAIGTGDLLRGASTGLGSAGQNRENFLFEELDPCEHLMVVPEGLPAAFRFFDRFAG